MDASYQNGLTALAGGGQTGATKIGGQASGAPTFTRFTTVATAGDSAVLPPAAPGLCYTVKNAGANSMNIFPASFAQGGITGGDQINALGANAAFALAAGKSAMFFSMVLGTWEALLSA